MANKLKHSPKYFGKAAGYVSRSFVSILILFLLSASVISIAQNQLIFSNGFEPCPIVSPDNDGDGFGDQAGPAIQACSPIANHVANDFDCDDSNAEINPDSLEVCADGIDNDCSGIVDDLDADGDGFISAACFGDDLDDNDALIGKLEPEQCLDGIDNDGDGLIDTADPNCAPGCDQDGDGYPSASCDGFDADDTDDTIFPGATEVCGDFKDNDQDGRIDEECTPDGIHFGPDGVQMISGQSAIFTVLDEQQRNIAWEFLADDGSIQPFPGDFIRAAFAAPDVTQKTVVTLTARDPDNPDTVMDTTTVTIYPFNGTAVILPGDLTIPLGAGKRFTAAYDVVGAGIIPLTDVVWQVNDVPGGDLPFGTIDATGFYMAPVKMPGPLPFEIRVGFSFSEASAVTTFVYVTLANLEVTPSALVVAQSGLVNQQLTAVLRKSTGAVDPVPIANLNAFVTPPTIATVGVGGAVTVNDEIGEARMLFIEPILGVTDTVLIHSRQDVRLSGEVKVRTEDFARIVRDTVNGATEIEFTRPGVMFNYQPTVTMLRGFPAGSEIVGIGFSNVTIKASGNIITYDPAVGVPQPVGVTAVVDRTTGFVIMGDTPGTGTITAVYDDGFIHREHTLTVTFTRPTIVVTVEPLPSGTPDDVILEQFMKVTVDVTNPDSGFVGQTPLRITLNHATENRFIAEYGINLETGDAGSTFNPQLVETDVLLLTAVSTLHPRYSGTGGSSFSFHLSAKAVGNHTIQVALDNDNLAPVIETPITVRRSRLDILSACSSGTNGLLALGSPVMLNSTIRMLVDGPIAEWPRSLDQSVLPDDVPRWVLDRPSGVETVDGIKLHAGNVSTFFKWRPWESGQHGVTLTFRDRTDVTTDELRFTPSVASDVAGVGLKVLPDQFDPAYSIKRSNQLGSFEIVESSLDSYWIENEPVTIRVQTYDATGSPRTVGYNQVIQNDIIDQNGNRITASTNSSHFTFGMSFNRPGGSVPYNLTSGNLSPQDASGEIIFSVTPVITRARHSTSDLYMKLTNSGISGPNPGTMNGLPTETLVYLDGVLESRSPVEGNAIGLADFENPFNGTFLDQCFVAFHYGLSIQPPHITVASDQVRQMVAAGTLPAGSEKARITIKGTGADFLAAIGSGLNIGTSTLGPGLTIESAVPSGSGDALILTVATAENALFRFSNENEVILKFGDASEWHGAIFPFRSSFTVPTGPPDSNIPLNGRLGSEFGEVFSPGTAVYNTRLQGTGFPARGVDLELVESFDQNDPGSFRGATVDRPLLGFKQHRDPLTGQQVLDTTRIRWRSSFVLVRADTTDNRRLDPSTGLLGPVGDPDGLPDFVSPVPDAERLVSSYAGNISDVMPFTRYNVIAQADSEGASDVPDMKFDNIKDQSVLETYSRYGIPRDRTADNQPDPGPSVVVHVDRETCCDAIIEEGDLFGAANSGHHLKGYIPLNYWGGVLDQYYQLNLDREGFGSPISITPVGKDGRVGGYDGEPGRGNPENTTGRNRQTFGIELDGVLYDPRFISINGFEAPNGSGLLNLGVVKGGVNAPLPLLTNHNLLPDAGGTSGGYFDVDPGHVGSFNVVSKTPGADYPGLYAGYLVQKTPQDFTTSYLGRVEENIDNLLIRRNYEPGAGVGVTAPPIREAAGLLFGGPSRRMMGFGTKLDKKAPISTAIRTADNFLITTDPPGLPPVKLKAALMIRELPLSANDRVNLLASTQSNGYEGHIKVVYDSVVDLVKEAIATAVLTTVTEGGYLATCSSDTASALKGEIYDLGAGLIQAELMSDPINPNERWAGRVQFAHQVIKSGLDTGLPFDNGVKVSARDMAKLVHAGLSESKFLDWVKKNANVPKELRKIEFRKALATKFAVCKLAKLPFTLAAASIKDVVSVSELGGGGAGDAFGYKTLALAIPANAREKVGDNFPGVFHLSFSTGQGITALPAKQASARAIAIATAIANGNPGWLLGEFPFQSQYFDLDSDKVSDRDLIRLLQNKLNDPQQGADARETLKELRTNGLLRTPDLQGAAIPYDTYLLRYGYVPQIEVVVAPKGRLPSGELMGDYTFTTNETRIPVSFSSIVSAYRTNQNAAASATVRTDGYEVIPFRVVIQPIPFE